jgi:hypothetical protein
MSMSVGNWGKRRSAIAVLLFALAAASACTSTQQFAAAPSEQVGTPSAPPPPPPPQPPPVDLAGRWRLSMTGAACLMTLAGNPGAAEGSIAPAGGCPGNFFTSRKWTYERSTLVIRDHKGEALAELSFADGRFQGQANGGGPITLARP